MKQVIMRSVLRTGMLGLFLFVLSFSQAQGTSDPVMKAKDEMRKMFGTVPSFFEVFPEHALPGVWEYFKQMNSPESVFPPKYRELLQLAVAAQIPCEYCTYFHTAAAKAYGATDAEVHEAVAHGAATRHWSMILQGNQIEITSFKKEVEMIFDHMSKQPEN
jgi:AhpD family alkylhydroperoxidase